LNQSVWTLTVDRSATGLTEDLAGRTGGGFSGRN
jgi:hypothetical protein